MKTKTWLPVALALVLGVIAAVLAKRGMSSHGPAPAGTVNVVVAQRSVAPGESLKAEDLELHPVAVDAMPDGVRTVVADLVGRTAQAQLILGQPVTERMLAPAGSAGGLQALVPPGMRAMTIEVNEFSAVGNMVTPGARVDIISTLQDPRRNESMSRTIAQNVLVKAVGQHTGQLNEKGIEDRAARSVTLIVTSKQAEAIQLAAMAGRPWLVLRGSNDSAIASPVGTTLAELRGTAPDFARGLFAALGNAQPVAATAAPNPSAPIAVVSTPPEIVASTRSVQVIRNTVETTVNVPPTAPPHEVVTGATIEP